MDPLHCLRNDRMPQKTLFESMFGMIKRGHPRRQWLQNIEQDLATLGVRNWNEKAVQRERNAKNCCGSQGQPWAECYAVSYFFSGLHEYI